MDEPLVLLPKKVPPALSQQSDDGNWTVCRCLRIRKIGKLYVLAEWRRKDKKKRMMLGPYWAFLLVTVSIIVGVTTVVFGLVVPSTFTLERIVGLALAVLALTSLLFTALSDPGIFPRYSRPLAESWTYSEYSQSYKPDGVVFCHQSQLLIEDYNHFCPWSGTVIGKGNEVYFQVFIVAIIVALLYDIIIIALSLYDIGA